MKAHYIVAGLAAATLTYGCANDMGRGQGQSANSSGVYPDSSSSRGATSGTYGGTVGSSRNNNNTDPVMTGDLPFERNENTPGTPTSPAR